MQRPVVLVGKAPHAGLIGQTFVSGAVLLASELNAMYTQIVVTNDQLVGTPRTSAWDMDGRELVLDQNGDSSIVADSDDRIDLKLKSVRLFRFHGTTVSSVNGYDFVGTIAGAAPELRAFGADTNIDVKCTPKGAGNLDVAGQHIHPFMVEVFGGH